MKKRLLGIFLTFVFALSLSATVFAPIGDNPDSPWPRPRIAPPPIEILCEDVEIAKI
ncbi:MAG: hypothetical protein FWE34_04945 [Defluviitaleaceae bacterium]|nr:hypothetical protein [Defluviitaleaceae bacterium]